MVIYNVWCLYLMPLRVLFNMHNHIGEINDGTVVIYEILCVSKITYLPLSTGHNNKGNPLIGVDHSCFIFIIPKGTKQVRYY